MFYCGDGTVQVRDAAGNIHMNILLSDQYIFIKKQKKKLGNKKNIYKKNQG